MEGILWLAILIVMVIIEIVTLGLTTIWFAGGALVAFIASLLRLGMPIQITLFIVVSFALLLGTRPFAIKYFNRDRVKTNVESLVGIIGIATSDIDNLHGLGSVQIKGQEWSARSVDDAFIAKGQTVQVENISGVKLIVKEICS